MLGKIAGALLIVAILAAAAGFLYGLGHLGYWLGGENGAVGAVTAGCVGLYHGAKWVWRNIIDPSTKSFMKGLDERMKEMEYSGQVVVRKRHKGKAAHNIKYACSRCGRRNDAITAMDERYTVMCVHCGFPHRLLFKGFW